MLCQEDKEQVIEHRKVVEDRVPAEAPRAKDEEVLALALAVLAETVFARNVAIRRCTKGDNNVIRRNALSVGPI
jgi:hypothetical protein